ncbi:MAG: hypothetical protein J0I12_03970 [Candidatus Eremiobacteraeota bacterium]|nr:hypothetical protein [Candidatus Eremiobacteraeota bacterium]
MHMTPPPGGHMGVHGMVMFGKNYLSHIPMFHEPHDYQIIMDVHLEHPQIGSDDSFGESLHTFVPDKFSLGDLLNGKLEKIQGTVYEGNFEDGGKPVLEGVTARIDEVLHSHHLSDGQAGAPGLEYVLYGQREDAYLVHPIAGGAAGFDQILHVDVQNARISDEELQRGVLVQLPGRMNSVENRLRDGETGVAAVEADGDALQLSVKKELSCLVGPHFMHGPDH